jgi:cation transport regulator
MPITAADAPKNLPKHAKEIYVSAWNNAYGTTCKTRSDRDECASKIAWSAVKKGYKKEGDTWVAKKAAPAASSTSNLPHGQGSLFGAHAAELEGRKDGAQCKCPECGATVAHKRGEPCADRKCPKCGAAMQRETSKTVKSLGGGKVGGYLVVWGSPERKDLVDEYFTKDTDFWLDRWNRRPLLYQHGLDHTLKGSDAVVGVVDDYDIDEIGLWIVAQLDMRHRYKQAIETLITEKALNLSSGALPRFVERTPDGFIKTWPIVEVTLTPTPAEYRLADVVLVKAAFEVIGEEFREEEDTMDEKSLWQKFGERLGFLDGDEDSEKATPKEKEEEETEEEEEKEKEKEKKSTPLPEFVLDESAVKAISAQVAVSMSEAMKETLNEVIVPLQEELDALKTWREEVTTRLEATEKTIHDKAMEIINELPPIVKVRATEVKANETDGEAVTPVQIDPQAAGQMGGWMELIEGIVERALSQGSGPQ